MLKKLFCTKQIDFPKIRYKNLQYFNLVHARKPKFGLEFFSCHFLSADYTVRSAHCAPLAKEREHHSLPQRPRSFWSAPRIATSGLVQRHSGFEWLCKHKRLRPEPIIFVRFDSDHAQSDGKSVNHGLPGLDQARGTQRSNECACLSHARAIERGWEWDCISILKQNGGRFKFRGICLHFAGIRRKKNS